MIEGKEYEMFMIETKYVYRLLNELMVIRNLIVVYMIWILGTNLYNGIMGYIK